MDEPLILAKSEWLTYILLPLFSLIYKFAIWEAYDNEIDFKVFVFIQTAIVVLTFAMDIFLFGRGWSAWTMVGGAIVLVSACAAVLYQD